MIGAGRLARESETSGHTATTAGAEFSGEEANQGEPGPLSKAEGLGQLLLGVLKGRPDRIHGGDWQEVTSKAK